MSADLRYFLLRYPSSSLSPVEKEALRQMKRDAALESPGLTAGMAVTDGSDEPNGPEQGNAPPDVSMLKRQPLILGG